MLEPVRPEAVLPDKALCLPTFSHFLIVNKFLSLSPPPVVGQSDFARVGRSSDYDAAQLGEGEGASPLVLAGSRNASSHSRSLLPL